MCNTNSVDEAADLISSLKGYFRNVFGLPKQRLDASPGQDGVDHSPNLRDEFGADRGEILQRR